MSLENWVRNNWLEQRASDAAEIVRLLALADGRLQDNHRAAAGKLSADVQLFLAYDAIRISATKDDLEMVALTPIKASSRTRLTTESSSPGPRA